mmetsp:Transcript_14424/g.49266  ORF Transcript_14424/g.49266 Transcript_14424/m.49266 type:complete len:125 (-) Transcript_14424:302-676(-)
MFFTSGFLTASGIMGGCHCRGSFHEDPLDSDDESLMRLGRIMIPRSIAFLLSALHRQISTILRQRGQYRLLEAMLEPVRVGIPAMVRFFLHPVIDKPEGDGLRRRLHYLQLPRSLSVRVPSTSG